MSVLADRLRRLIRSGGPIGVDQYMAICLYDPQDGYYTTREPFGVEGDFVTAPEVSQMFGELVAVWLVSAWQAVGCPKPFTLAEIGPGRGTLMADVLRTLRRAAPNMIQDMSVVMVEISPRLQAIQRTALSGFNLPVEWKASIEEIAPGPLLVVGNEIFDALPMRQFVRVGQSWLERTVETVDQAFAFGVGSGSVDPALLPMGHDAAPIGAIAEIAPAREALMQTLAERIAAFAGAGLFFDYGEHQFGPGDTFQALSRHIPVSPLERPGEADLTSHVDFGALRRVAQSAGLATAAATQGDFLLGMGLLERAGALGAPLDTEGRARIERQVERLAGPAQMGRLFKVLAIASPQLPSFPTDERIDFAATPVQPSAPQQG